MKAFHVPKAVRTGWSVKMLIGVIIAIALLFTGACMRLAASVMTGYRQNLEEAMEWQSAHYDASFYQGLEKTDYVVSAHDGYVLHVQELRNPNPTDNFVILLHGYTDNRLASLKYVPMYLDLGLHCVIYDLRGHGENEPTFTAYGILEGKDLAMLIEDTKAPEIARLGLHGESIGVATRITALKYQPKVDFVVADCGFSDIENVLREGYKNANIPVFLADMADLYAVRDGTPRYCILTTEANSSMRGVHSRIPLVLRRKQVSLWLRQSEAALRLLRSIPPELEKTPESAQLRLW